MATGFEGKKFDSTLGYPGEGPSSVSSGSTRSDQVEGLTVTNWNGVEKVEGESDEAPKVAVPHWVPEELSSRYPYLYLEPLPGWPVERYPLAARAVIVAWWR